MKTLYSLNIDSIAKISHFGDLKSMTRLLEMGMISGAKVRLIKKTPFGGPVQVKINDYYLILRKEDATKIYIVNSNEK